MGVTTVQRCTRRCDNWIEHWPDGPIGNTRSCADIYEEQHTGLRVSHAEIQGCSHTGRWACGVAPWREPYELRGSRTVLREPRGETPWGYSPHCALPQPRTSPTGPRASPPLGRRARLDPTPDQNAVGRGQPSRRVRLSRLSF